MPSGKSDALNVSAVGALHNKFVLNRRVSVLANWFAKLLPSGVHILDVGCGDGLLGAILQQKRPDVTLQGVDVVPRAQNHIPVTMFDGTHIPFENESFDLALFSDVLHHTIEPTILLREAHRVVRNHILIKDHYREGLAAKARLSFMDWVGNARFGVSLPYNYLNKEQWNTAWHVVGLEPQTVVTELGLYPKPADWIFGDGLHFIALLRKLRQSAKNIA